MTIEYFFLFLLWNEAAFSNVKIALVTTSRKITTSIIYDPERIVFKFLAEEEKAKYLFDEITQKSKRNSSLLPLQYEEI